VLAIFVTHADAQKVEKPRFRALSDQGRAQVDEVVARFRTAIADVAPDLSSKVESPRLSIGLTLLLPNL
jgi:hypothetical protein